MNELFSELPMSLTHRSEKTVTTKELAEMLGVDVRTVQRASEKLFDTNVVKSISTGGRPTQVFTEAQATAIKIELQNHTKVAKSGFDTLTISNDLEMLLMQQRLNEYQSRRIAELQAENEAQKQKLAIAEPKAKWYDEFVDASNLVEIGVVGKHLEKYGLGAKKIFERLKADKIIYERIEGSVKTYLNYFRYKPYFATKNCYYEKPDGKRVAYTKLMFTAAGVEWAESKYGIVEAVNGKAIL